MAVDPDKRYALVLLIKEMMTQLNEVAYLRSRGAKAEISMMLFREMASILPELDDDLQALYYDILLRFSSKKTYRRTRVSEDYVNLAAKARKRFVLKMKDELIRKAS